MRFIIECTQEEMKALINDGVLHVHYDGSESEDCEECECEDDEDDKAEKLVRETSLKIEICNTIESSVDKLIKALE